MANTLLSAKQIWVNKNQLSNTKIVEKNIDPQDLKVGEVLLKIECFGFSANNITYAVLGDKMGYWGFFEAHEDYGIVPVWGFATIAESTVEGINKGERFYGYLPMASYWVVRPTKITGNGFFDGHALRKSISPVYDNYLRCEQDPGYSSNNEAIQMNIRPLFMTSFVLDDFVGELIDPSVKNIVVTSASSKTAYGTAHLLLKHKAERGLDYRVIGLTSKANQQFTEQLLCYDEVVCYQDIDKINPEPGSWVLDFAGNKALLLELQKRCGASLSQLVFIGATDVEAQHHKPQGQLDGELFFAPAQVSKRTHEWGQKQFFERYALAWRSFSNLIEQHTNNAEYRGAENICQLFQLACAGKLNNSEINILRF